MTYGQSLTCMSCHRTISESEGVWSCECGWTYIHRPVLAAARPSDGVVSISLEELAALMTPISSSLERDAAPKYTPDVECALEQLQRLFDACGQGDGRIDSGWTMVVVCKAMEALREGKLATPVHDRERRGRLDAARPNEPTVMVSADGPVDEDALADVIQAAKKRLRSMPTPPADDDELKAIRERVERGTGFPTVDRRELLRRLDAALAENAALVERNNYLES